MIITCPSCQKKFELDDNLLPENGRTLQCGSCNYKWFFKKKDEIKVFEKQLETNENEKIGSGEVNIDKQLNILKNQNSNNIGKKKKPISKSLSIFKFLPLKVVFARGYNAFIF